MGLLQFLGGVERQLNPLDNGATFKNPQGNGQAKSAATQAKDLGWGFLKGTAHPFAELGTGLAYTPKAIYREIQNKPITDVQQRVFGTSDSGSIARKIVGDVGQAGLTVATPGITKGAEAIAGKVASGAGERLLTGALSGAAVGAPYNVAGTVAGNEPLTKEALLKYAVLGGVTGAALGTAGEAAGLGIKGAKASAAATKAAIEERAASVAGLKPSNVVSADDLNTLRDYNDYKRGSNPATGKELNQLIRDGRAVGSRAGIDVTSGSPAAISSRIEEYVSQHHQFTTAKEAIAQGGYIDIGGKNLEKLSKADEVPAVKKQLQDVVPAEKIQDIAPAIANTTDTNIIKNITDTAKPNSLPQAKPVPNQQQGLPEKQVDVPPVTAPPETTPLDQVTQALRGQSASKGETPVTGARTLQEQQKALYSAARSTKLAQATESAKGLSGEEALNARLGAYKGELPKVNADKLTHYVQTTIDQPTYNGALDQLLNSAKLQPFEQTTAANAWRSFYSEGKLPRPSELALLEKAAGSDFTDNIVTTASLFNKAESMLGNILGNVRSFKSTADLSFGGRQGILVAARHPADFIRANYESIKYAKDSKYFESEMAKLHNDEWGKFIDNHDASVLTGGGASEEAYAASDIAAGKTAKKLGVGHIVAGSERAYTGGLTKLRRDILVNDFKAFGDSPAAVEAKLGKQGVDGLIEAVRTLTGRGGKKGGWISKNSVLSQALFSPKLWASRLEYFNPKFWSRIGPAGRAEAIKSLGAFSAVASTVLGAAAAAGGKVETDPRSSDFLKIKFGDSRYDILGGLQQNLVFFWREATGETKSSVSGRTTKLGQGYGAPTRVTAFYDVVRNKANPLIGSALNIIEGKDKAGNKINPLAEIGQLFVPISIQGSYQAIKETGSVPGGLAKNLPDIFGISTQTYGSKDIKISDRQQAYVDQLKQTGGSPEAQDAAKSFYQYLKTTPDRQKVSDQINQALAKGDTASARQLAQDYNQQYASTFKDWAAKYADYASDPQLVKDYNSGKINLSGSSIKSRLKNISTNPLFNATYGGSR